MRDRRAAVEGGTKVGVQVENDLANGGSEEVDGTRVGKARRRGEVQEPFVRGVEVDGPEKEGEDVKEDLMVEQEKREGPWVRRGSFKEGGGGGSEREDGRGCFDGQG